MDVHDSAHFALDHEGPTAPHDHDPADADAYAAEHATELITASIRANVAAHAAQLAQLGQYVDTDADVDAHGGAGGGGPSASAVAHDVGVLDGTKDGEGDAAHAHAHAHAEREYEAEGEGEGDADAEYRAAQPSSEVMALYGRSVRDEGAPHPELLEFESRADFEPWLENELSWCHYVQRRVTTPEKRAEERVRGRERAHQRLLASLPPDEAAALPPLKRRRRMRTSAVDKKVTYTCHHAGTYETRHSTTVPSDKLRMKTKKSVKCGCSSRIVCNEMSTGEINVAFYWKHVGHDPYQSAEMESTRLPKVVDEWVIAQLEAGRHPEEIRKMLEPTEERKAEYLSRLAEDPEHTEPDMPPALAFAVRIKYPDIYNRYRKYHGPLRGTSQVRGSQRGPEEHVGTSGHVLSHGGVPKQVHASAGVHDQDGADADHDLVGMDPALALAHPHDAGVSIGHSHGHVERLTDHVHSNGDGLSTPHPLSARVEDETALDEHFGDAGTVPHEDEHEHEHVHEMEGPDADAPQDEASVTASLVNVLKRAHEAATAAAGQGVGEPVTVGGSGLDGRVDADGEGHADADADVRTAAAVAAVMQGHADVGGVGVDMGMDMPLPLDMGLGMGVASGSGSSTHTHDQAGMDGQQQQQQQHADIGLLSAPHGHGASTAQADADAASAALLHAHMGHVDAEHFYDDDGQMNIQMTEELEKLANEITSHWRQ